jgi:hypothetical protein
MAATYFYCFGCDYRFSVHFRGDATDEFECPECGEMCGSGEDSFAQEDNEGRFRCARHDDSPDIHDNDCDDAGTGEGRWHGRI